jgi:hypothetical protein
MHLSQRVETPFFLLSRQIPLDPQNNMVLGEISGSHNDEYEDDCLLGFYAVHSGGKQVTDFS